MSQPASDRTGRIGPNAILQILAAVRAREGEAAVTRLTRRAGLEDRLARPIVGLVPVAEVRALHIALLDLVGLAHAHTLVAEAGRRTASYLLGYRIPYLFRQLLRLVPTRCRSRLLLAAITRHAWTFTGGGLFRIEPGSPPRAVIEPCPLCPEASRTGLGCVYYAATFEELLRTLVDPRIRVEPVACEAAGSRRCTLRSSGLSA